MIAVYPGSFDPITYGHLDIINRAVNFVDTLVVAILNNPAKKSLFTVDERKRHIQILTKDMPNIKVESFSGLLVDFAKENNANIVIRGLRALTDFEYEFQMALTNRELNKEIETIFIPTTLNNLFISSSIVKEIAEFKGDISKMVPNIIEEELKFRYGSK